MRLMPLGVLFLAGCASTVQWDKPGATREAADTDGQSCSVAAQSYATLPRPRTGPTGVDLNTIGSERDADRQLQQAQRVEDCMRRKGYTLRAS